MIQKNNNSINLIMINQKIKTAPKLLLNPDMTNM